MLHFMKSALCQGQGNSPNAQPGPPALAPGLLCVPSAAAEPRPRAPLPENGPWGRGCQGSGAEQGGCWSQSLAPGLPAAGLPPRSPLPHAVAPCWVLALWAKGPWPWAGQTFGEMPACSRGARSAGGARGTGLGSMSWLAW